MHSFGRGGRRGHKKIEIGSAFGSTHPLDKKMPGAESLGILKDQDPAAALAHASADPFNRTVALSVLGIGVGYDYVRRGRNSRAVVCIGHANARLVCFNDIPREDSTDLAPTVIHDLYAEVDLSQFAASFMSKRTSFLKVLMGPAVLLSPGDDAMVVLDAVNPSDPW